MDVKAVAQAIASRFSAANVTPPSGQEDIKLATASLPEGLAFFPTVLVMPARVEDARWIGQSLTCDLYFGVVLFLGSSDGTARRADAMNDWITALYLQLDSRLQLGLPAWLLYAQWESVEARPVIYANEPYDAVTWTVRAHIHEATASAA